MMSPTSQTTRTFRFEGTVRPEYVAVVKAYLKEKEWPHACVVVKPWHAYLGQKGWFDLIDAYMYFHDYPMQGYAVEAFQEEEGKLVLEGGLGSGVDIETMVALLLRPMCIQCTFEIQAGS